MFVIAQTTCSQTKCPVFRWISGSTEQQSVDCSWRIIPLVILLDVHIHANITPRALQNRK